MTQCTLEPQDLVGQVLEDSTKIEEEVITEKDPEEGALVGQEEEVETTMKAVSSTHLTLPTKRIE